LVQVQHSPFQFIHLRNLGLRQPIPVTPKPILEIDGIQTGRLDINLKNQHSRLVELTPQVLKQII